MSDDSQAWLGTALPLDDVGSNRVELAGRFAEYVDRLVAATDRLTGTRPLAEWLDGLARRRGRADPGRPRRPVAGRPDAARAGPGRGRRGRARQPARCGSPTSARCSATTSPAGPTRANFRAGSLTVCTMVPMRSVPHRVVCLLGPRRRRLPAAAHRRRRRRAGPHAGHRRARRPLRGPPAAARRDRRRDRDAGRHLHRRRPAQRPGPAARRTPRRAARRPRPHHRARRCATASSSSTRSRASTCATSSRAGSARRRRSPSTRRCWRAAEGGDRAAAGRRRRSSSGRWPSRSREPARRRSRSSDLVTFFRDPVKGFFRALDLTLPWDVDGVSDAMPVEIDQLETWGVGDRMLADMLRGIHPDTAREIEWRRGALPPGQLGWRKATEVRETAMNLAVAALTHRQVAPQALRRRHRAARRPPAHRHHHPGLRRPAGRGRLLQARRQAPARVVGPAAGARGRPPRPQLDRADDRPGPARHPGRPAAARPDRRGAADACSPTWSTSTTRAGGRRSSCRSRRRSPGRPRPAWGRTRKPEALQEVAVQPVPRRGRRPRPRPGLGRARRPRRAGRAARPWRERLWFPLLASERGPL